MGKYHPAYERTAKENIRTFLPIKQIIPCEPGWLAVFMSEDKKDTNLYFEPLIGWALGSCIDIDLFNGFAYEVDETPEVYGVILDSNVDYSGTQILLPGRYPATLLLGYKPPDSNEHEIAKLEYWKEKIKEYRGE